MGRKGEKTPRTWRTSIRFQQGEKVTDAVHISKRGALEGLEKKVLVPHLFSKRGLEKYNWVLVFNAFFWPDQIQGETEFQIEGGGEKAGT